MQVRAEVPLLRLGPVGPEPLDLQVDGLPQQLHVVLVAAQLLVGLRTAADPPL